MTFSSYESSLAAGRPTVLYHFMLGTGGALPEGPTPPGGLVASIPLSLWIQVRDVSQTTVGSCFPSAPDSAICGPYPAGGFESGITVFSRYNPNPVDGQNGYFYARYDLSDYVVAAHDYTVRIYARETGGGGGNISGARFVTDTPGAVETLTSTWAYYDIDVTSGPAGELDLNIGGFDLGTGASIISGLGLLTIYDPALPPPTIPPPEESEYGRTSFRRSVTYNGLVYTPCEIEHTDPSQGQEDGAGTITITLPADDPVSVVLSSSLPPSRPMVAIYQYHRPPIDPTEVRSTLYDIISVEDTVHGYTLTCASILARGDVVVPSALIQRDICAWRTYDPLTCGIDPTNYTYEGIVTAITGLNVTVDIAVANLPSTEDSTYFEGGQMSKGSKQVMIKAFTEDPANRVFELHQMIPGLVVGDIVQVLAGDDRSPETCRDRFGNSARRLSFPNMPTANPYYGRGLGT